MTLSEEDYELKLLGKYIFFDRISDPAVMSCATCHEPKSGGTGRVSGINRTSVAITGANPHTVGSLKPPTNSYATFIPPFRNGGNSCGGRSGYCGGNFWNGRAVGFGGELQTGSTVVIDDSILGDKPEYEKYLGPVADQALNPFPNPVEQNISPEAVCLHVEAAEYAVLYEYAWGEPMDCGAGIDTTFKRIGVALSAYQASSEINSFSSKRDFALRAELNGEAVDDTPGKFPLVGFTDEENYGHDLFYGTTSELNPEGKNARCNTCHLSDQDNPDGTGLFERYADDAYHNIGTPKNYELENPEPIGTEGLAGHNGSLQNHGERKAPSLRNVDKRPAPRFVKAYGANGWFKSLESIVHFYNTSFMGGFSPGPGGGNIAYEDTTAAQFGVTRCAEGVQTERQAISRNCWPAPEFPQTTAPAFLVGNLGLTAEDEAALVAYMKTFTDEVTAQSPRRHELFFAILKNTIE